MDRKQMISLLIRRIDEQRATNQHASARLNAARLLGLLGMSGLMDPSRVGLQIEAATAADLYGDHPEPATEPAAIFNPDEGRA